MLRCEPAPKMLYGMARSALEATLRQVSGGMVEVSATELPGTYAQAPPL